GYEVSDVDSIEDPLPIVDKIAALTGKRLYHFSSMRRSNTPYESGAKDNHVNTVTAQAAPQPDLRCSLGACIGHPVSGNWWSVVGNWRRNSTINDSRAEMYETADTCSRARFEYGPG